MFAPLIVKPQAKTAVRPSDNALTRGTTDHDREIEREQTSERTRQIGPRFPNKESAGAWDFSKIPLHPQGRRDGPDRLSPASAPHLPGPIQSELKIGAVNEPLEYEADLVADQVMRMPDAWVSIGTAQPQINRKCDASEQREELQKRAAGRQAVSGNIGESAPVPGALQIDRSRLRGCRNSVSQSMSYN